MNSKLTYLLTLFLGLGSLQLSMAQGSRISWDTFVEQAEGEWHFFYKEEDVSGLSIASLPKDGSLLTHLQKELKPFRLFVSGDASGNIFISKGSAIPLALPKSFYQKQKTDTDASELALNNQTGGGILEASSRLPLPIIRVGEEKPGRASKEVVLSGYLENKDDGAPVLGVSIGIKELQIGTNSNSEGFFAISLPSGTYTLIFQSLNFREERYQLDIFESGRLDFKLSPKLVELDGVVLTARRDERVQGSQMGFERLSAASVKEIPLVLGERDVLKIAQLLPGIQSVGEGSGGFNVRGSPADQNLFYINDVPVYNTSHLFGFFSAFNSDAISEFSIAKASIPASYGGRLASIFDVTTRQGNKNRFKASGGISPVTGRVLVEGPIQKGKSSFLIGARTTYSNWILKRIQNLDFQNTQAGFGDAIMHISMEPSKNDKLNLFGYYSRDNINFAGRTAYNYQNFGGSLSWFHLIRGKHSLEVNAVRSQYGLEVENSELAIIAYRQDNEIIHNELKTVLSLRPNDRHEIRTGFNTIFYDLDRGSFLPLTDSSGIDPRELGTEQALESGIFISDLWQPVKQVAIEAGLRYNHYIYLGPQDVYSYTEGQIKSPQSIIDTLRFGNFEPVQTYSGLDFRLSSRFLIRENLSVKASYNRLHQYIFLLSNTIALAPSDKWKLTDPYIKPMVGDQVSLGVYGVDSKRGIQLSLEGYVKNVMQLVEFRDGADLLINENPEQDVLQGRLLAYGAEFLVKKPFGRFNGWVSYAYSRSLARVANDIPQLQINDGFYYPANFDKPHAVNVVANYKFTRRLSVSSNLVYATGRPITYPSRIYYQNGIRLLSFSSRNADRIPDYFRIDASIKVEGNLRAKKLLHGSWILSIYNLLGRDNAYSVFFQSTSRGIVGNKLTIFGSPVVSLTYDFKLGNYAN